MALVLIVDDNKPISLALEAMVRSLGHDPMAVHGGKESLALLRARPVDLVLLDVMMPGMSGLDVLRAMRADGAMSWPPVVMFSSEAAIRDEALSLGAAEFVDKMHADKLADTILRHLGCGGH